MISSGVASDGQIGLLAVLSLAALVSVLGDSYTTMIGLQHGFVEGNPVVKWLFKKVGQSFAAFLSAVLVLFLGGLISNYDLMSSYVFFGIVTAGETFQTVRNYLKLRASKISLK